MIECLGEKPRCPNGNSPVCNTATGEWVCKGVAKEDPINNVEQSDDSNGRGKGSDCND